MPRTAHGLPVDLGDGLTVRWARRADVDELVEFNCRIHGEPDLPADPFVRAFHRFLEPGHPTTTVRDFTVVRDARAGGKIVSSLCVIPQTCAFDGVAFPCGRPEFVGTDPDYRRRGLVRTQMDAIHRKGASRGELMQVITGIPWYYRLFGYEMALELGAGRRFYHGRPGNAAGTKRETLAWRPARVSDIPLLRRLYAVHCDAHLVATVRDRKTWRYELAGERSGAAFTRTYRIVTDGDGTPIAYVAYMLTPMAAAILEFGVAPGRSWREVALFLVRRLREVADEKTKEDGKDRSGYVSFVLGPEHPAYVALGPQLEAGPTPYAWYVRVPDMPKFLRRIRPVLDARLAASPLAGHSGSLRLNLVREHVRLDFEDGRLARIGTWRPKAFPDGDGLFADQTFLLLLFGQRAIGDFRAARVDCGARNAEAEVLLGILFPRRGSHLSGLM